MTHRNSKKSVHIHWIVFALVALFMLLITGYGFWLSHRPNSFSLDSAPEEPLALVGVALANNIGTGIPRSNEIPVNLPQDVEGVQSAIMKDGFGGESFFAEHFQRIGELREVSNIDIVAYLRVHPDRMVALEEYIQQLNDKKEEAKVAVATLTQLRDFHNSGLTNSQNDIKTAQAGIEQSYVQGNGDAIMLGLTRLEELHIEEQEHKNITLFCQRFMTEYNTLINFTEKKLTLIRANKEALVQGVTVSLPSGTDVKMLKDLHLFTTDSNK